MMIPAKTEVLFVLPQLGAGGSERVVLELVRHLDADRFVCFVAAFSGGQLEAAFRELAHELLLIPKRPGFDPKAILAVSDIIRQRNIAVVNAHHYMPLFYAFLGAKLLNRRRLIYTEHSVPEVELVCGSRHRLILGGILPAVDAAVGVSQEIALRLREAYPRSARRIHTIPNGVDLELFQGGDEPLEVRRELGLETGHFVIGMVANFRRVKNHACLLKALALLQDAHPRLQLLLIGRGYPDDPENSEPDVRRLIVELGLRSRVRLTGYRDDIPRLLTACDVFCLPSFSEGLPVSVLEAMAARVPVIGSNVRGIREVLAAAEAGLLFDSDDHRQLAERMETLLNHPDICRQLAERARAYVESVHGIRPWVQHYADLFRSSQPSVEHESAVNLWRGNAWLRKKKS